MVVHLLLQGVKPVCFMDAVKHQLTREDGCSDSPSKLMTLWMPSWISLGSRRNVYEFLPVMRCRISQRISNMGWEGDGGKEKWGQLTSEW